MLNFHENPFGVVLADLVEATRSYSAGEPLPLPCDRYVARSALQKSVRRGEVEVALQALATMFLENARSIWRHLAVIAIEDIGVADVDLVAQVIASCGNSKVRTRLGGDWKVASLLVRRMAESNHCQAACDLMLVGLYRPELERCRADALEASTSMLAAALLDATRPVEYRGIAAMALAGVLAEGQGSPDPHAVFDIMGEHCPFSHVVGTARAAWRLTRDPMALMLPLVWSQQNLSSEFQIADDDLQHSVIFDGVPDYALDQHTRAGSDVARAFLRRDKKMQTMLNAAGVPDGQQAKTVGNLMFLVDGSPVIRRARWETGEALRSPCRLLPKSAVLSDRTADCLAHIRRQWPVIASLRATQLSHLKAPITA